MVAREQQKEGSQRRMSGILWDLFTGSAPYRDILMRTFHPGFMAGIGWNLVAGNMPFGNGRRGNGDEDGV
jgi:hypothetical protein